MNQDEPINYLAFAPSSFFFFSLFGEVGLALVSVSYGFVRLRCDSHVKHLVWVWHAVAFSKQWFLHCAALSCSLDFSVAGSHITWSPTLEHFGKSVPFSPLYVLVCLHFIKGKERNSGDTLIIYIEFSYKRPC